MSLQRERNRTREVGMDFGGSFDRPAHPASSMAGHPCPDGSRLMRAESRARRLIKSTRPAVYQIALCGRQIQLLLLRSLTIPGPGWYLTAHRNAISAREEDPTMYVLRTSPRKKVATSNACWQLCICVQNRVYERAWKRNKREMCLWQ